MSIQAYLDLLTQIKPHLERLGTPYKIIHPAISLNGVLCQVGDLGAINKVAKENGADINLEGKDRMEIITISDVIEYFSFLNRYSHKFDIAIQPGQIAFSTTAIPIDEQALFRIKEMVIKLMENGEKLGFEQIVKYLLLSNLPSADLLQKPFEVDLFGKQEQKK